MNIREQLKKFRLEPAMLVLFVFIMLVFSRFVAAGLGENTNEYLAVVILQLLTFGLPAAVWCRLRGLRYFKDSNVRYSSRLRFSAPRPSHIVIIIAAFFALASGCLLLSLGFSGRSSLEGSFSLYDVFVSKYNGTPLGAVWLILAYAALPAFCEELVFRGILCAEYDRYGVVCSVSMSTLWFAFLHFSFEKLLIYIFAGLVLSLLLYATRSVFSVMIAHFLYNVFGLFGQQYLTEFYITAGSTGVAVTILIMILLLSAAVFCGCARRLYGGYAKRDEPSDYREPAGAKALTANFRECIINPSAVISVAFFIAAAVIFIFI